MAQRPPIIKEQSVTSAEAYLANLAESTFLSLWSYPSPTRDEQQTPGKGDGKEVCDLLVVFGSHVIIFSDKHVAFDSTKDLKLAWSRWFSKAILKSADQAWGAKSWLTRYPDRVFVDRKCTQRLPVAIPTEGPSYHLVVVAHGITQAIRNHLGGSGTLMLNFNLDGRAAHCEPFQVGDVDSNKPFIHILDDESLEALMGSRDTVSDFVEYLEKRERLLRDKCKIIAPGEEELLANYLSQLNAQGERDFQFVEPGMEQLDFIVVDQGGWSSFQRSEGRKRQVESNEVSYTWDVCGEVNSRSIARSLATCILRSLMWWASLAPTQTQLRVTRKMPAISTAATGQRRIKWRPSGSMRSAAF
jgi:hypothetical protein